MINARIVVLLLTCLLFGCQQKPEFQPGQFVNERATGKRGLIRETYLKAGKFSYQLRQCCESDAHCATTCLKEFAESEIETAPKSE